jgi:hypothetical protein
MEKKKDKKLQEAYKKADKSIKDLYESLSWKKWRW